MNEKPYMVYFTIMGKDEEDVRFKVAQALGWEGFEIADNTVIKIEER